MSKVVFFRADGSVCADDIVEHFKYDVKPTCNLSFKDFSSDSSLYSFTSEDFRDETYAIGYVFNVADKQVERVSPPRLHIKEIYIARKDGALLQPQDIKPDLLARAIFRKFAITVTPDPSRCGSILPSWTFVLSAEDAIKMEKASTFPFEAEFIFDGKEFVRKAKPLDPAPLSSPSSIPVKKIYIFHDAENCPLPQVEEMRDQPGGKVLLDAKDASRWRFKDPGKSRAISGAVVYDEVIRATLSCLIGKDAAGRIEKPRGYGNIDVTYYFVNASYNPKNPKHPTKAVMKDLESCSVTVPTVGEKADAVDTEIKTLIRKEIRAVKDFTEEVRKATLFVLISGDGDFKNEIDDLTRNGIRKLMIYSIDSPARSAYTTLFDFSLDVWVDIVEKSRSFRSVPTPSSSPLSPHVAGERLDRVKIKPILKYYFEAFTTKLVNDKLAAKVDTDLVCNVTKDQKEYFLTPFLQKDGEQTFPDREKNEHACLVIQEVLLGIVSKQLSADELVGISFSDFNTNPLASVISSAKSRSVFVRVGLITQDTAVPPTQAVTKHVGSSDAKTHVFHSHKWASDSLDRDVHARVRQVNAALKRRGFLTWFDEEMMQVTRDNDAMMSSGIDNTDVVLVYITKEYLDAVATTGSPCNKEFTYALNRKKKIFPIVFDPSMKNSRSWSGPVAFNLNNTLYVDLSANDPVENLEKLIKELVKNGVNPEAKGSVTDDRKYYVSLVSTDSKALEETKSLITSRCSVPVEFKLMFLQYWLLCVPKSWWYFIHQVRSVAPPVNIQNLFPSTVVLKLDQRNRVIKGQCHPSVKKFVEENVERVVKTIRWDNLPIAQSLKTKLPSIDEKHPMAEYLRQISVQISRSYSKESNRDDDDESDSESGEEEDGRSVTSTTAGSVKSLASARGANASQFFYNIKFDWDPHPFAVSLIYFAPVKQDVPAGLPVKQDVPAGLQAIKKRWSEYLMREFVEKKLSYNQLADAFRSLYNQRNLQAKRQLEERFSLVYTKWTDSLAATKSPAPSAPDSVGTVIVQHPKNWDVRGVIAFPDIQMKIRLDRNFYDDGIDQKGCPPDTKRAKVKIYRGAGMVDAIMEESVRKLLAFNHQFVKFLATAPISPVSPNNQRLGLAFIAGPPEKVDEAIKYLTTQPVEQEIVVEPISSPNKNLVFVLRNFKNRIHLENLKRECKSDSVSIIERERPTAAILSQVRSNDNILFSIQCKRKDLEAAKTRANKSLAALEATMDNQVLISADEDDAKFHFLQSQSEGKSIRKQLEADHAVKIWFKVGDKPALLRASVDGPHPLKFAIFHGSILNSTCDAIVNAANGQLDHAGGVAKSIAEAAGQGMIQECIEILKARGDVPDGSAVVTSTGLIKEKNPKIQGIIHAVGPRWPRSDDIVAQQNAKSLYKRTVQAVLQQCLDNGWKTVAFPLLGSSIFGWEARTAAELFISAVLDWPRSDSSFEEVVIIDNNDAHAEAVVAVLKELSQSSGSTSPALPHESSRLPPSSSVKKPQFCWEWESHEESKWVAYDYDQIMQIEESLDKGLTKFNLQGDRAGIKSASKHGNVYEFAIEKAESRMNRGIFYDFRQKNLAPTSLFVRAVRREVFDVNKHGDKIPLLPASIVATSKSVALALPEPVEIPRTNKVVLQEEEPSRLMVYGLKPNVLAAKQTLASTWKHEEKVSEISFEGVIVSISELKSHVESKCSLVVALTMTASNGVTIRCFSQNAIEKARACLAEYKCTLLEEAHSIKWPSEWVLPPSVTAFTEETKFTMYQVEKDSGEWKFVVDEFSGKGKIPSMLFHGEIVNIQRVQNPSAWYSYYNEILLLASKNKSGVGNVFERANERWLKHGTSATSPTVIAEGSTGVDCRYTKGGFYGYAAYNAEDTSYSDDGYKFVLDKEKKLAQLFITRVACGKIQEVATRTDAYKSYVKPLDGFNSVRGPVRGDHKAIMVYEARQCYPAYLVTYKSNLIS